MQLRPGFEPVRSQLLNREPPSLFDDVLRSVISEKTRFGTPAISRSSSVDTVLAVTTPWHFGTHSPTAPHVPRAPIVLLASSALSASSDGPQLWCHYCKRLGHSKC